MGHILREEILIYIPLCFYFIVSKWNNSVSQFSIYIPLCFYFIASFRRIQCLMYLIYIPLCFYFIWFGTYLYSAPYSIYIPLCFYFIAYWHRHRSRIYIHLHSTMLLLYPLSCNRDLPVLQIYIPLCFYFILRTYLDRLRSSQIYIPLCFYFISESSTTMESKKKFTFHYASTLSVMYHMQSRLHTIFTFHYASTLSPCACWRKIYNADLHSTMLLLYRRSLIWSRRVWNNLHSTMLLLYQSFSNVVSPCFLIYIPLCFYFIIRAMREPTGWNTIYIPLCFYFILVAPQNIAVAFWFTFHYASTLSGAESVCI